MPGDTDFTCELKVIQGSRADAIVLWADEIPAANILKQMRALGTKQRVFGSYRTLGAELLAEAGSAAKALKPSFPTIPPAKILAGSAFIQRFDARFHDKPEQSASLSYDSVNALLDSVCKAGLNRARIRDALAGIDTWNGVTGKMAFDPNQKNIAPMYLGTVRDGAITYRPALMQRGPENLPPPAHAQAAAGPQPTLQASSTSVPYARVGEEGVGSTGPHRPDLPQG